MGSRARCPTNGAGIDTKFRATTTLGAVALKSVRAIGRSKHGIGSMQGAPLRMKFDRSRSSAARPKRRKVWPMCLVRNITYVSGRSQSA
jgi:hypothetical protein